MDDAPRNPQDLVRQAATKAAELARDLQDLAREDDLSAEDWLLTLGRVGADVASLHRAVNDVSPALGLPAGAHDRIIEYLKLRVGQVVTKDELAGVAGISEWARRVRELRVEQGWAISTNANRDDLRPGEYVLESPMRDLALAERWKTANSIRRRPGSAKDRILEFYLACQGEVVSKDEIAYVAQIADYPRRIRELSEDGWQIQSHIDDSLLRPGEYTLISDRQLPPRSRQAIKQRHEILERDGFLCRICGSPAGNGRVLQVHHRVPVAQGGGNDDANLLTLCQMCHGGVHARLGSEVGDELLRPELEPG